MKRIGVISTAALFLLLGVAAPAYARQDQQQKPPKQEQRAKPAKRQQQAKPARQQQARRQQQQTKGNNQRQQQQARRQQQQTKANDQQQQAKRQQQQTNANDQRQQQQARRQQGQPQQRTGQQSRVQRVNMQTPQVQRQEEQQQQGAWQEHRANNWQSEHRTWQQRGGYNGYRIPDDRYNGYFGRDHAFRIYSYPVMVVGGYPRFQYDGFWFSLVDPWPEYWSNNWYENDEVYIEYSGDGYYMYDTRYPRDRIAVSVYVN
ncbi:MAG TPA: hypothetical protein VKS20_02345 [Candidatus Acidoferrales bacterium]|nr:hypothetical protein [Candidatus Acidoferrales bacterium]